MKGRNIFAFQTLAPSCLPADVEYGITSEGCGSRALHPSPLGDVCLRMSLPTGSTEALCTVGPSVHYLSRVQTLIDI